MSNQNTINHFSHNHPLTEVNGVGTYTCDGCKLYGESKTYRCNECNYDLHEYCATCPATLTNSMHGPDHELSLINGPAHMTERGCYVCRAYIQGMFYKCKQCTFESHPLCAQGGLTHDLSQNEIVTKERKLHDHAVQKSSLHHYGQVNPYMDAYWAYPYGGYHHHHYYHQHQHDQIKKPDSPKADPNKDSSKGKKKKGGFLGVIAAASAEVAANLVVATITGSVLE